MADLSNYSFIDCNSGDIIKLLVTEVEAKIGEPLYPGDERRVFIECLAPVIVQLFNKVNDDCRQRLLPLARGQALDGLGARLGVTRLEPTPAKTTLRFTLAKARDKQTFIPAGTRASPDGNIQFATIEAGTIEPGALALDLPAECTTAGSDGNGYPVGSIQTMTDVVAYISGVSNTTVSADGTAGEPLDDGGKGDERYRERILLAPAKLSTAGPGESYRYWAMSSNASISDVKIPADHAAGCVDIVVYTKTGLPSQAVLNDVLAACNDAKVRPMGDKVAAIAPTAVKYDINLKYYVTSDTAGPVIAAIENAGGAIDVFKSWQDNTIGRDINPDKLRVLLLGAGALRLDVTSPKFTSLTDRQIAQFSGNITLSHEVTTE